MTYSTLFISHSTRNDAEVDQIAERLETSGFNVWVDHRAGIIPGTPSWDKAIREAIQTADAALFVMSPAALESEICGSECLLVRELGVPLYVLKLADVSPAAVWLYIKQIQYADLSQDLDAGMQVLLSALGQAPPVDSAPQPVVSRFTGEHTLRQYLPFVFNNPMRGRDADLQHLCDSLNGVVQVTGTGGLGKSRLVAELALAHASGAVWYRCSAVSGVADLQGLIMQHVQLPPEASEHDMLSQLRQHPQTLIVLDNAEDVPPEQRAAFCQLIIALQIAGAHIVLTSRVRWDALIPCTELTPVALDVDSATAIALDFAQAQSIPLDEAQAQIVAVAARHYPRLIEWAIGQMNRRPFERVLGQLQALESRAVQDALNEMIRRSLQQMTAQEGAMAERVLLRLVVCVGLFEYAAAAALLPDNLDEDDLDDALDRLLAWRFVRYDTRAQCYTVDEMVRLCLPLPDDHLRRMHFTYYHALHSDYAQNQAYADDGSMLRHESINRDWDNILVALVWGFDHEAVQAVDWALALQAFMLLRRSNQERADLLNRALTVAQRIGYRLGEANCLQDLGEVDYMRDEYADAITRYRQALELYRAAQAQRGQAYCLKSLADTYMMLNDYDMAVTYYQQALPLYRIQNDQLGEAHCLRGLGGVDYVRDKYQAALMHYEQALALYRTVGDRLGEANCLKTLGDTHSMVSDYATAHTHYQQALSLYQAVGDRLGQAHCLHSLGDIRYWQDEYAAAIVQYERAAELARAIGSRQAEAHTLRALGDAFYLQNENTRALKSYQAAILLYQAIGDQLGEANSLRGLGDVWRQAADYDQSIAEYEAALAIYRTLGARLGQANSLRNIGDAYQLMEAYPAASANYEAALDLYRALDDSMGQMRCLRGLADVYRMDNAPDRAIPLYEQVLALCAHVNDFPTQLNCHKGLAFSYYLLDDLPKACQSARETLALADDHPFFATHPVVQSWREVFSEWGCF